MAVEKEIWGNSIVEGLFADNTFASRSLDHSMWVNNKIVHLPQAGAGPNVEKNRATLPATAAKRVDTDLTYSMAEFTTDPILLPEAEKVELSYNKRESLVRVARNKLADKVYGYVLSEWISGASAITPGSDVRKTILAIKKQFDKDDVLQVGRCILLDSESYNDLLNIFTDVQAANFLSGADPVKGVVGKYYGFDIYSRSTLDGTQKGLAWQADSVAHAMGAVETFTDEKNPMWYGDILSFLVRVGAVVARTDSKGILKF